MLFGVCTFNFVFYIVRLLPGSELPDRAAAAQTAQVYALWVGDASGTQVACKLHARCASDEFKAILKLFFAILRHFKFQLCFFLLTTGGRKVPFSASSEKTDPLPGGRSHGMTASCA